MGSYITQYTLYSYVLQNILLIFLHKKLLVSMKEYLKSVKLAKVTELWNHESVQKVGLN